MKNKVGLFLELDVLTEDQLEAKKAEVELKINKAMRNLSQDREFFEIPVDIESELWTEAKDISFNDFEFLKRSVVLKVSLLSWIESQ